MVDPRHGWLVAVLPAETRRFRTVEGTLSGTLIAAGAELVPSDPDVELARDPAHLVGDANWAAVVLDAGDPTHSRLPHVETRALRAALRATSALGLRLRLRGVRRGLASRGYDVSRTMFWEPETPLNLNGPRQATSLRDRFPLGAVVTGTRGSGSQSLLERVATEASEQTGREISRDRLRLASWGVVALGDSAVLRATVGPARRMFAAQVEALEELRVRAPTLERIVPWPLAAGRTGVADWLVEPRLPGAPPEAATTARILDPVVDVLAALHAAGEAGERSDSPSADADVLAEHVPAELARGLRDLGSRLDARLAELPRSFAHGDFSPANLLVHDGSLSGIVDWNKARQGQLPLLDFLNLLLTIDVARSRRSHGDAFVRYLLPWSRAGGDERSNVFCARIGLGLSDGMLEDLATGWWLDRHAHQIATYSDRRHRPAWLRENVERPLRALLAR